MPLMIDAASLLPYLQMLDVHGKAICEGLEMAEKNDSEKPDEYALLIEATASYEKTRAELVQRVRELVEAADLALRITRKEESPHAVL